MSLYLETSCLLKLVLVEPESAATERTLGGETDIMVSDLTRLEAENVLFAMRLGGEISKREQTVARRALAQLLGLPPFRLVPVPGEIWGLARAQVEEGAAYCRTLDRLHLAVVEAFGLKRIMTCDRALAKAAVAEGFETLIPV